MSDMGPRPGYGPAVAAAESLPDPEGSIDAIIDGQLLQPLFQLIVDLDGMFVAGYEALARGPVGPLHTPDALFRTARACDRLVQLDWLCRVQAVELARHAGLRHPISLFINAEPEALVQTSGDRGLWAQFGDLRCYAEVTERALTSHPAELLRAIDQVREDDWGVAVDDVAATPRPSRCCRCCSPTSSSWTCPCCRPERRTPPTTPAPACCTACWPRPRTPARCWSPRGSRPRSSWTWRGRSAPTTDRASC